MYIALLFEGDDEKETENGITLLVLNILYLRQSRVVE